MIVKSSVPFTFQRWVNDQSQIWYTITELPSMKPCLVLLFFMLLKGVIWENPSLWAIWNWSESKLENVVNIKNTFQYIIFKKTGNNSVGMLWNYRAATHKGIQWKFSLSRGFRTRPLLIIFNSLVKVSYIFHAKNTSSSLGTKPIFS